MVNRATTFFYLGTVQVVGYLIAPPITYFVIRIGAWNTLALGIAFLALTIPVAALLPETKDFQHAKPIVAEEDVTVAKGPAVERLKKLYVEGAALLRYQFWENKLLGLTLFSLIFTSVGKSFTNVLQLYGKTRFHWQWEEVSCPPAVLSVEQYTLTLYRLVSSVPYRASWLLV